MGLKPSTRGLIRANHVLNSHTGALRRSRKTAATNLRRLRDIGGRKRAVKSVIKTAAQIHRRSPY